MSVRAARLARAASKQSMQPPAAEQSSDASLDDMLNRVESLVQRAQSDLPHDIETACSLEASRGRVEREALCAELHSVEDECALLHVLTASAVRHGATAATPERKIHSAHAAAALQGAQRAHPLIVRELERRCGALLMQAAGQRRTARGHMQREATPTPTAEDGAGQERGGPAEELGAAQGVVRWAGAPPCTASARPVRTPRRAPPWRRSTPALQTAWHV